MSAAAWLQLTSSASILAPAERERLLGMLWDAQADSARDNVANASNATVRTVAGASLSLTHTLAAAMLATGGLHAPVIQARKILFGRPPEMPASGMVPGFGNSFFRDRIDPAWQPLSARLQRHHGPTWSQLVGWHRVLRDAGKACHPNAAAITAAVAELVGWPDGLEPLLVIQPRMAVWAGIYAAEVSGKELMK